MQTKLLLASLLLAGLSDSAAPERWTWRSPIDLVADGKSGRLFVAESGARRISILELAAGEVTSVIPLPAAPSGLALSADGERLFVTGGVAEGRLWVVDPQQGTVESQFALGHSPLAPTLSADGESLWIANRFQNALSRVDLATGRVVEWTPTVCEPIACALTPDGATLLVAGHRPSGPSTGVPVASQVAVIDAASGATRALVELPDGSTAVRDLCLSPDGRHAFVPHVLARYHHPTTQLERGWVNTNALSVIEVDPPRWITTVVLDQPELGAANPWGAVCTADGEKLVVTHAGSHCASVVDLPLLFERLAELDPEELAELPARLGFLQGVRQRVDLGCTGPRGVAVLGQRVFAAGYFSDGVACLDLSGEGPSVGSLPLGPLAPPDEERLGEILFHDAKICFQEWQSCASCHPDGRTDGLNWDLLNDGFGNPKNTKSLLLSHATPPSMVSGVRPDGESCVRAGLRHIHFALRPDEEAHALDVYLRSLEPAPSPHLVAGELSSAARQGRVWFEAVGCIECHPAPLFTDLKLHDLAHTSGLDEGRRLDTPTLVETWRTGPYLHDGRAADLRQMLLKHDPEGRHGGARDLDETQLEELLAYVLSL